MPVTGNELWGRSLSSDGAKRLYKLHGPATEDEVSDWIVAHAPDFVGGFPFASFSAEEDEDTAGDWDVQVDWGKPAVPKSLQQPGKAEFRFNFVAPGGHIYRSLQTISRTILPGASKDDIPPKFGGLINVVSDDGKYRAEGLNLSPPPETYSLSYTFNGGITDEYEATVRSLAGKVNSVPFRNQPAGSVQLVRVSGGRTSENQSTVEFGFSFVENAVNIPVGDITVPAKDGHDLLWALNREKTDVAAGMVVIVPIAAYVERVFPRADLNLLNLP